MNDKRKLSVDDAYSVETPDDNIRLYADWADRYDSDFVSQQGYIYHLRVAELLIQHRASISGAVLDVGCGTGIVGIALRDGGFSQVDGIDISPQMLEQSRGKSCVTGLMCTAT